MRMFVTATTGLPGILATAALVITVFFWLLVAIGVTSADSLDADADLGPWGMGGVPVAVALTLLTVLAWLLGIGSVVLLADLAPSGTTSAALRPLAPVAAGFVAWRLTRRFVRPLHRLFPDEGGPAGSGAPGSAA
ncbi:hypothetical protein [Streptomyces sp. NPDC014006]|uniref:hypothetical protein n=1 Tax=Streptomyces sp. NPDC014006 TaxID=3364870 RepID=UPI0036FB311B